MPHDWWTDNASRLVDRQRLTTGGLTTPHDWWTDNSSQLLDRQRLTTGGPTTSLTTDLLLSAHYRSESSKQSAEWKGSKNTTSDIEAIECIGRSYQDTPNFWVYDHVPLSQEYFLCIRWSTNLIVSDPTVWFVKDQDFCSDPPFNAKAFATKGLGSVVDFGTVVE
ncbi:hypothetical protein NDU88_000581 [Pleurodeles waltl]|uniref:Uncharacterized protein n=1 Tax=Pleurodeles waltl TaxID=8319 RepID=A0AAV7V752_PLEWA|nr:hypothetical protein NDU88_000581 [Pleurodeles waltl]